MSFTTSKDTIEIIAPTQTLKVKGETGAEHRHWAELLQKLCCNTIEGPIQRGSSLIQNLNILRETNIIVQSQRKKA